MIPILSFVCLSFVTRLHISFFPLSFVISFVPNYIHRLGPVGALRRLSCKTPCSSFLLSIAFYIFLLNNIAWLVCGLLAWVGLGGIVRTTLSVDPRFDGSISFLSRNIP